MYKLMITRSINRGNLSSLYFTIYQRCHADSAKKSQKPYAKKMEVIKKYWFTRYLDYLKNYDKTLEKTFPRMMHIYRIISTGTKEFYADVKKYIVIRKKESLHGIDGLSQDELKLRHTLPQDLVKISPFLIILAIPFTNYVLFPLAYFFPRIMLTSHYWTDAQKEEFMLLSHKRRSNHKINLLRQMEVQGKNIKDEQLQEAWNTVINQIKDNKTPSTSEILSCKELFISSPFSLKSLKRSHVKELLLVHDICTCRFNRGELLMERGMLIKRMDIAIIKEGGVSRMTTMALKWALSFRGINPLHMSPENMQNLLDKWLQVSTNVDMNSISLLLHCPVLLIYNRSWK